MECSGSLRRQEKAIRSIADAATRRQRHLLNRNIQESMCSSDIEIDVYRKNLMVDFTLIRRLVQHSCTGTMVLGAEY